MVMGLAAVTALAPAQAAVTRPGAGETWGTRR